MAKVVVMDHPLIQHKIGFIRRRTTGTKAFRETVGEIAMLICYEATRDLELEDVEIDTPVAHCTAKQLKGKKLAVVPILRAGLGMVDGLLELVPGAHVGHLGMYRNEETHEPVEYFCKLPKNIADLDVYLLDPMLATGGSGIDAVASLYKHGVKKIHFLCIIAAPEGVETFHKKYPEVPLYIGALDRQLNENCYICPGLGDAGDRIFGTLQ